MRLSFNEVRARAARFAAEWKDASYERGDTQSFYNDFFEVFGVKRRQLATYEAAVQKISGATGYIDLFWPGTLVVEQKSAGRDLSKARTQAFDYLTGLKPKEHPRYVLTSDFQTFELYDLEEEDWRTPLRLKLADLSDHVEAFGFILGIERRPFRSQDPVNIEASELMGELYDRLRDTGYPEHELEQYLVRLLFCLFADDTGIFEPKDILFDLIEQRTSADGSDTGQWLDHLFQVLDTPEDQRVSTLDEDLDQFPYINGDLFRQTLRTPSFDSKMREQLLGACRFNWQDVSPAIFGSLFQFVMDPVKRRGQGEHYTSEHNILKVIEPLFLDDLRREFEHLKDLRSGRNNRLRDFLTTLSGFAFLDPACGCGNFLVIAYRELRRLEIEVLTEIYGEQMELTALEAARVDVTQFHGIEIEEFPARIAEVAMWMMDHIMNNHLSLAAGQSYARIPLKQSPHIVHTDALETDWSAILSPDDCTYVLGNPPFGGSKYQTDSQRAQVRRIAGLPGAGGTLDFVTAWFILASSYGARAESTAPKIGFVSTNSITQGEQVAQLWPTLFERYRMEIAFAHQTFEWTSEARNPAHVHCVIVGLSRRDVAMTERRLFIYDDIRGNPLETRYPAITAYLFGVAANANRYRVVEETSRPINGAPRLASGTQPIDGGHLILSPEERDALLTSHPDASPYVRPYTGAKEYLNQPPDEWRSILYLKDVSPSDLRRWVPITARLEEVRKFRATSKRKGTLAIKDQPARYNVEVVPDRPFLTIPEASSVRRSYVPIGWLEPPTVPSNLVRILLDASPLHFGVLTSAMHMAWLRHIGGRLKSDYRYSIGVVYNTFPWPRISSAGRLRINRAAEQLLRAREAHSKATLADLYDPNTMPAELRQAHIALDRVVDRLYRRSGFRDDQERVEHLFGLYDKLVARLSVPASKKRRKQPRVAATTEFDNAT